MVGPGLIMIRKLSIRKRASAADEVHIGEVSFSDNTDKRIEIVRGDSPDFGLVINTENGESPNSLAAKRRHVIKELIETEKLYVNELQAVLRGYIQEMDNPDLMPFIPEALQGNQDILFSNWDKIYEFHSSTFLVELESYINTPTLVGKCFVKRKEELDSLYSTYCQNKPRSEVLRRECGNDNPFFQECQRLLGHKLPLSAYLLKPVQRITKYQLLLREMFKYSSTEPGANDLKTALDCMLTVIKYVNDTMHQVAITGFEGKLSDLGKLLMQGALYMWVDHKKRNLNDIRQRKMQRHVFLYEKSVLFCKKRGDIKEKTCYAFKSSLKTAGIGLTEHVKGDKKKFEMWSGGRVDVYTFQAPSENEKMSWVKATRQALLQNQQNQLEIAGKTLQKPTSLESGPAPENATVTSNGGPLPSPTASDTSSTGYGSANPSLASEHSLDVEEEENEEGWASGEFSDSDDETLEERREVASPQAVTVNQYVVLAEYNVVEDGEMAVKVGDIVNVQKVELCDTKTTAAPEKQLQIIKEVPVQPEPSSSLHARPETEPLPGPRPEPHPEPHPQSTDDQPQSYVTETVIQVSNEKVESTKDPPPEIVTTQITEIGDGAIEIVIQPDSQQEAYTATHELPTISLELSQSDFSIVIGAEQMTSAPPTTDVEKNHSLNEVIDIWKM